jgi:hypothetical protein
VIGGRAALGAAVAALAAGALTAGVLALGSQSSRPDERTGDALAGRRLPTPAAGGLPVGRPVPLDDATGRSFWAAARATTPARAAPSASARRVGTVTALTPEQTTNVVLPLGRRRDAAGRLWVRVRLAGLPNGRTGWVPRRALGAYGTVRTRLVVDRRGLTATLLRDGRPVLRMRVGVGRPGWPTPTGSFYVRNRLTRFRSPAYGPIAFGTSARSPHATGWPAGGFVGIHGTDRPDLIPGRVSHGCIRLRNADIRALARVMPVGTRVTVH